ncbi:hypothetical protein GCM10010324_32420 [Streptomyces hiroshimensis]|uniref:Integrase n=1 Tax=Streptomyces hiroshimensis TaxID=66424 RepID=A0ABQ2YH99_9ACTN|nr:hypothetical protein GCM10010324_32420 [Streptomyces hiroshimensis]
MGALPLQGVVRVRYVWRGHGKASRRTAERNEWKPPVSVRTAAALRAAADAAGGGREGEILVSGPGARERFSRAPGVGPGVGPRAHPRVVLRVGLHLP